MSWLIQDPQFDNSVEILSFNLELNFGLPSWVLAFTIVLLAIWSGWSVFQDTKEQKLWQRILLSVFRWGVCTMMLVLVLQPRMNVDHMVQPKSQIAIMLDNSESMNLVDAGAPPNFHQAWATATGKNEEEISKMKRSEIAQSLFHNESLALPETFEKDYNSKLFSFGEKVSEINHASLKAWPEINHQNTQVGSGLREVSKSLEGLPLSSVILFTDGASNRGDDPVDVARSFAERGIKIFPVAIGYQDAIDIRVSDLRLPDFIFKESDVALEIVLETRGLIGETINLEIKLGEQRSIKRRCKVNSETVSTSVSINSKSVGTFPLVVKATPHHGENVLANNKMEKQVQVIEREIRVLLAVEGPSWEYRYLKSMLDRDPRYVASVYMRRGDIKRKRSDTQFLDRFPFENLNRDFDLLIFNNLNSSIFDSEKMKLIRDFVSESGGSLIMLSATHGTPSSYAATPIGQMLPIEFETIESSPQEDFQKTFAKPFKLSLTQEGQLHPLTQLSPLAEENRRIWKELPHQYWWYKGITKAKRSATVLVEHQSERNENGPIPLIATHSYGKGEVVFVGINSIWRWRHRVGNRYTQRFWGQAVQYLGLPHLLGYVDPIQINTSGREFELGKSIDVNIRALDENFEALKDAQVILEAKNAKSGERLPFPISATVAGSGRYRGQIFLEEGDWQLELQGRENQNPYPIKVFKPQYELQNPAMDFQTLNQLATMSGGKVILPDQLSTFTELLKDNVKLIRLNSNVDIWDSWVLLILFILFACGEWALRKVWSLP